MRVGEGMKTFGAMKRVWSARSALSETVDFTISNDADEVESIGSIRDESVDPSELSVSRASQLLSSADTTRDESILLRVESELNSHPLKLEEEVLEAYGEAEYSDDNDPDVDENLVDNLNEKSSEVLNSIEAEEDESLKEENENLEENKNDSAVDENLANIINANISEQAPENIEPSNESTENVEFIGEESKRPIDSDENKSNGVDKNVIINIEHSEIDDEFKSKKESENLNDTDKTEVSNADRDGFEEQTVNIKVEESSLGEDNTV